MWSIEAINAYMRDVPSKKIVANEIQDVGFFKALTKNFNNSQFQGLNIVNLLKVGAPMRTKAHGERLDLPGTGNAKYYEMKVPLAELITNAGITKQALDRATGMPGSWGRIVNDALDDMETDFEYGKCLSAIGNGTGALCRVSAAASDGTNVTVTSDSTYTDFFWDNVHLIREGMLVEIYSSDGNTKRTPAGGAEVLSVTFGNRKNGAATTGSFVIAGATDLGISDNDIVYIHGAKSEGLDRPFAMGMAYIFQDGVHFSGIMQETNAYGLARATYKSLRARIIQASDFGLTSEGPVDGTPTYWDLSMIDDQIIAARKGSGKGQIDTMMANSDLARCIMERNHAKWGITVNLNDAKGQGTTVSGTRIPTKYIGPNGEEIDFIVDELLPNNCLAMFPTRDVMMHQLNSFDYLRMYGDIWGPTKNDRKSDYEAPYGGYLQFSADRCDNCIMIQDMRTNI